MFMKNISLNIKNSHKYTFLSLPSLPILPCVLSSLQEKSQGTGAETNYPFLEILIQKVRISPVSVKGRFSPSMGLQISQLPVGMERGAPRACSHPAPPLPALKTAAVPHPGWLCLQRVAGLGKASHTA